MTEELELEDRLNKGKHTADGLELLGLTYFCNFAGPVYDTNEGHFAYFDKEIIHDVEFYKLTNYVVKK